MQGHPGDPQSVSLYTCIRARSTQLFRCSIESLCSVVNNCLPKFSISYTFRDL